MTTIWAVESWLTMKYTIVIECHKLLFKVNNFFIPPDPGLKITAGPQAMHAGPSQQKFFHSCRLILSVAILYKMKTSKWHVKRHNLSVWAAEKSLYRENILRFWTSVMTGRRYLLTDQFSNSLVILAGHIYWWFVGSITLLHDDFLESVTVIY